MLHDRDAFTFTAVTNSKMATEEWSQEECAICSEPYNQARTPKFLPCFHTFCEKCLTELAKRAQEENVPKRGVRKRKNSIFCPACRQEIPVPAGGVATFQTNFYLSSNKSENESNSRNIRDSGPGDGSLATKLLAAMQSQVAFLSVHMHSTMERNTQLNADLASCQEELKTLTRELQAHKRSTRIENDRIKTQFQGMQTTQGNIKKDHASIVQDVQELKQAAQTIEDAPSTMERNVRLTQIAHAVEDAPSTMEMNTQLSTALASCQEEIRTHTSSLKTYKRPTIIKYETFQRQRNKRNRDFRFVGQESGVRPSDPDLDLIAVLVFLLLFVLFKTYN